MAMKALILNTLTVVALLLLLGSLPTWQHIAFGQDPAGDILVTLLVIPFAVWLAWSE
jgi:hypothetical protein